MDIDGSIENGACFIESVAYVARAFVYTTLRTFGRIFSSSSMKGLGRGGLFLLPLFQLFI